MSEEANTHATRKEQEVDTQNEQIMTEKDKVLIAKEVVDHELVESAYNEVFNIFSKHVENAIIEVGRYLLEHFYENNIEFARDKRKCPKRESLNRLIERLNNRSSYSPSKSWIYQAIGLVVQEEDVKKMGENVFQMYGKLMISHKVCLLPIKTDSAEVKKKLIKEAVEKKLTVEQLKDRKEKLFPRQNWKSGLLSALEKPKDVLENEDNIFSLPHLKNIPTDNLKKAKTKSEATCKKFRDEINKYKEEIEMHEQYITGYEKLIGDIETAIIANTSGEKAKKNRKKKG